MKDDARIILKKIVKLSTELSLALGSASDFFDKIDTDDAEQASEQAMDVSSDIDSDERLNDVIALLERVSTK